MKLSGSGSPWTIPPINKPLYKWFKFVFYDLKKIPTCACHLHLKSVLTSGYKERIKFKLGKHNIYNYFDVPTLNIRSLKQTWPLSRIICNIPPPKKRETPRIMDYYVISNYRVTGDLIELLEIRFFLKQICLRIFSFRTSIF